MTFGIRKAEWFWVQACICPWNPSPSSGVWKVKVEVAQLCPTLCNPMDFTVHGILQARILEWVAFPFSRRSSQLRDQTQVSCIEGEFFTSWATRESLALTWVLVSVYDWVKDTEYLYLNTTTIFAVIYDILKKSHILFYSTSWGHSTLQRFTWSLTTVG